MFAGPLLEGARSGEAGEVSGTGAPSGRSLQGLPRRQSKMQSCVVTILGTMGSPGPDGQEVL